MSYNRNSDEAIGKQLAVYECAKPSVLANVTNEERAASNLQTVVMLPKPSNLQRVETGAIQFGDDWPGVFIRGDNAAYYSRALDSIMTGNADPVTVCAVAGLRKLLNALA